MQTIMLIEAAGVAGKMGGLRSPYRTAMTAESGATMTGMATMEIRGVFLHLRLTDTIDSASMRLRLSLDMTTITTKADMTADEVEVTAHKDESGEQKMIISTTRGITAAKEADQSRLDQKMTTITIEVKEDPEDILPGLQAARAAEVDIVPDDADRGLEVILVGDVEVAAMMKSAATVRQDLVQQIRISLDVAVATTTTTITATRRKVKISSEIRHQNKK